MLGVLFALSASLGFGASAVFARVGLQHIRATSATLISLIVGTVITMTLAFIFHSSEIMTLAGIAFAWLLLSAALNFPAGRLLNFTAVSMAGVSRSSPIVGASPLFATILAITLGGESINLPILLGTLAIISGIALILSQSR